MKTAEKWVEERWGHEGIGGRLLDDDRRAFIRAIQRDAIEAAAKYVKETLIYWGPGMPDTQPIQDSLAKWIRALLPEEPKEDEA